MICINCLRILNLIKLFHYLTLNSMRCPAYAPKLRTNPCDTDVLYISYVSQLNSGMASVSSGTVHITSPLSSKQNNVLGVILQHTLKYFKYTALKTTYIFLPNVMLLIRSLLTPLFRSFLYYPTENCNPQPKTEHYSI